MSEYTLLEEVDGQQVVQGRVAGQDIPFCPFCFMEDGPLSVSCPTSKCPGYEPILKNFGGFCAARLLAVKHGRFTVDLDDLLAEGPEEIYRL